MMLGTFSTTAAVTIPPPLTGGCSQKVYVRSDFSLNTHKYIDYSLCKYYKLRFHKYYQVHNISTYDDAWCIHFYYYCCCNNTHKYIRLSYQDGK